MDDSVLIRNLDGSGRIALAGDVGRIFEIAASPRGGYVAVVAEGTATSVGPSLVVYRLPKVEPVARIDLFAPDWQTMPVPDNTWTKEHINFWREMARDAVMTSPLAWSPYGDFLAFTAAIQGPSSDLYIYSVATGQVRRLTDGKNQAYGPSWSPNGRWIAHEEVVGFVGTDVDGVWAAHVDGVPVNFLYDPRGSPEFVGWKGTTGLILYERTMDFGPIKLRVFDVESMEDTMLFERSFEDVASNKAGTRLAMTVSSSYSEYAGLYPGVYIVDAMTGERTLAFGGEWRESSWSTELNAFVERGEGGVVVFDENGKTLAKIPYKGAVYPSPDGTLLAFSSWSDSGPQGLSIYTSEGELIIHEKRKAPSDVIWDPDAQGICFFTENSLYHFSLVNGYIRNLGHEASPQWLTWVAR